MALLVALMKLAHVFAGFWMVAGLVGRGVTQVRAERLRPRHRPQLLLRRVTRS